MRRRAPSCSWGASASSERGEHARGRASDQAAAAGAAHAESKRNLPSSRASSSSSRASAPSRPRWTASRSRAAGRFGRTSGHESQNRSWPRGAGGGRRNALYTGPMSRSRSGSRNCQGGRGRGGPAKGGKGTCKGKTDIKICIPYLKSSCRNGDACVLIHLVPDQGRAFLENLRKNPCRGGVKCDRADCVLSHPPGRALPEWQPPARAAARLSPNLARPVSPLRRSAPRNERQRNESRPRSRPRRASGSGSRSRSSRSQSKKRSRGSGASKDRFLPRGTAGAEQR